MVVAQLDSLRCRVLVSDFVANFLHTGRSFVARLDNAAPRETGTTTVGGTIVYSLQNEGLALAN